MRYVFSAVLFAYAAAMLRHTLRVDRQLRAQIRESEAAIEAERRSRIDGGEQPCPPHDFDLLRQCRKCGLGSVRGEQPKLLRTPTTVVDMDESEIERVPMVEYVEDDDGGEQPNGK